MNVSETTLGCEFGLYEFETFGQQLKNFSLTPSKQKHRLLTK